MSSAARLSKPVARTVRGFLSSVLAYADPSVFTYKEIMQLVLKYSGLEGRRLILSLPYWLGMIQAFFLEKLPESNLTLTQDQVSPPSISARREVVDPCTGQAAAD